jgi:agmatine deiminase
MPRILWIVVLLSLATWFGTQTTAAPPTETPTTLQDDTSNPLPRYMTEEEKLLPLPSVPYEEFLQRTPPTGVVHTPAEYEQNQGLFIAWEGYTTILTQMVVSITTQDPEAVVYVVVDTPTEQTTASSTLSGAGADMSQVQFIIRTTDSVWIRDYGPRFIFEDGNRAIIDHVYNRPLRPNDDAFNDYLAALWAEPQYDIPLTHGGGNFHLFTNGEAFMSSLILAENPGLTEQDVKDLFLEYENVDLTIYTGFPTSFDSTRHIDMWMFPLGDDKILIGQYSPSTGQPYTITEGAVADLTARGYTVYRTPGWNTGGVHYTYTNAVILNDLVFISTFGGSYTSQDAQALSVFQTALPDKTIQQIDSSSIIGAAGALHCIMMHVPAYANPIPSAHVLSPNGGEVWMVGTPHNITWSAYDDVGVTGIDLYYSTDGGTTYPHVIATGEPNDGVFSWTIPHTLSTQCRVKVVAHDADLNSGEDVSDADFTIAHPPPAPQAVYSFPLDADPGWTTEGQWAFGDPAGLGSHNHDPNNGYTGTNVYGYNLNGDYPNNLSPTRYLKTTVLDCSNLSGTQLRFWRWLGVEGTDQATVEVSNDGTNWTVAWDNPSGSATSDSVWSLQTYDLAAVADGQPTVYVRWGMGPTDSGVTYPGWNLDDVEVWAITPSPCDVDGDSFVDMYDYGMFCLCLTTGPGGGLDPGCEAADLDGDGDADLADFALFQECFAQ